MKTIRDAKPMSDAERARNYRARLRGDPDAPEPQRPGPKYTILRLDELIHRRLCSLSDEIDAAIDELFPDEVWPDEGPPPGYEGVGVVMHALGQMDAIKKRHEQEGLS